MTSFVALLRAGNVGGTGKLPMSDLKALCENVGLQSVRTYIASGNVVFTSADTEPDVKATLEARLHRGVFIRTGVEMTDILSQNPFKHAPANRVVALFLDQAPTALNGMTGLAGEWIELGRREIYIHYPDGIGASRLRLSAADTGTARNIDTIARLATMAAANVV